MAAGGARRLAHSGKAAAALTAIAAIAALAALQWVPPLLEKESLRDRHLVHELIEAALTADPAGMFRGHGWGRTQDAFHTWLNVSGERLWSPRWTFLFSDYFHSHSWALEALYSAGIPGVGLMLARFVAIPLFAAKERRPMALAFAVALALFHGLWFQLSLSLPVMAMAMAALAGDTRLGFRLPPRVGAGVAALLGMIAAMAAVALFSAGLSISRMRTTLDHVPPLPVALAPDFRGSDLAFAELVRDQLTAFADRAGYEPKEPIATAIRALLQDIDQRVPATRDVMLLTTGLTAMTRIQVDGDLGFAAEDGQMAMWRRWLDRLLMMAPGRTDQAIPYFTAALARNRMDEVEEISAAMLSHDPGDPVGLYYHGLTLVVRPSPETKARGRALIREAIRNGMDRFMPIDPKLKSLLEPG